MKKGIKNLAIATMVGVATMGLMTGCGKEDIPYIQVSGLDTAYIQNEDINLEGAKILYYSNKNDTTADEIKLTEGMIANFSTEETGEKKMKVLWNGFELEINYTVISVVEYINLYNTAYDNMINANHIHSSLQEYQHGVLDDVELHNYSNGKHYGYYGRGTNVWSEEREGRLYYYSLLKNNGTRIDITEEYNSVIEYAIQYFTPHKKINYEQTNDTGKLSFDFHYDISSIETIINNNLQFDVDGDKSILTLTYYDNDNDCNTTEKITIQNNKIIQFEFNFGNEASILVDVSYNIEDVVMVDLPTDVVWKDATEE